MADFGADIDLDSLKKQAGAVAGVVGNDNKVLCIPLNGGSILTLDEERTMFLTRTLLR